MRATAHCLKLQQLLQQAHLTHFAYHCTFTPCCSKLTAFDDLQSVCSFGFRGEALSSLCELAGAFTVTTRTAAQNVGVRLSYSRAGKLLAQEPVPRAIGTTVSVVGLFSPLPVRQGEFRRSIVKQYNK